jgi:hypothetical protein
VVTLSEELNLAGDSAITLAGGYDTDFSAPIGFTTVRGSLTIGGTGAVTISNMIYR